MVYAAAVQVRWRARFSLNATMQLTSPMFLAVSVCVFWAQKLCGSVGELAASVEVSLGTNREF